MTTPCNPKVFLSTSTGFVFNVFDDQNGDVEVWLDIPEMDFDGVVIGHSQSLRGALGDAIAKLQMLVDDLTLASLKEMRAMCDGVSEMASPGVTAKLERATAAIAKAEGR